LGSDPVLTARQRQILESINQGLSNKQIAQRLSLGTSTVKNHVHGLLGRLQVGRSEAATRLGHGVPHPVAVINEGYASRLYSAQGRDSLADVA
jgi:DNA-binding CsgD family transcriptional regulator